MSITAYAFLVAQCFIKSLAQGNAYVFDGVMRIDFKIAFRLDPDIHHAMTGHLIEHVVKERQSGLEFRITVTIQLNLDPNRGFFRLTTNLGRARAHTFISSSPICEKCIGYTRP